MIRNKKIYVFIIVLISLFSTVFAEDENNPVKKEIDLEDGYYEIPIRLWHAVEEKPSMGNKALRQIAEIEVKDKEANLYIGSDKMEYMSITASLINIYFQKEDGNYYKAEPGCYELEVPKEQDKRPEVFKTSLLNMDKMTKVYVDPKVEPMGDEPIRARINLDFEKIKKISGNDSILIKKFKEGAKKPEFNSKNSGEVQNKNLIVKYGPETFSEEFSFYGNRLSGKEAEQYSKEFDKLDQINIFNIEFLGPLDEIREKEENIQSKRKKIYANKEFDLKLPLLKFKKEDNLNLYYIHDGNREKLDFKITDDYIETKTKNSGVYIVVKSSGENIALSNNLENSNQISEIKNTADERGKTFMASVRKPQVKKTTATQDTKIPEKKQNSQVNSLLVENSSQNKIASQENNLNSKNIDTTSETLEKTEELEEKESKRIIYLIVLIFIGLNAFAIVFVKKNLKEIKDMREEIVFLGGLEKNEK